MENKIKYNLIFLLFIMIQLVSCQNKNTTECPEEGFCISNKKLFYNQKPLALGMPIEKFIEAVGKYDRKIEHSIGGEIYKEWYWKKQKYEAYTSKGKITFRLKENEYKEYSNIEEIIKKYGKYDSTNVEKVATDISTFYVWDKLGFNVWVDKGMVEQINISPIHKTKMFELKQSDEEILAKGLLLDGSEPTDEEKKNYNAIMARQPKSEFKGNITYNGNTADFSKIGYKDWQKAVSSLKIAGSDFDPPGDSEGWSRWIKEDYELYVTLKRFNNKNGGLDTPNKKKVGDIDGVESIEIWRHKNYDK
ncbi:DUF7738 domain-containing protein [Chryseobacterium vrystaatense]|uniref:DUF7738 domain-containing protein n=1 Tax=Chryseobacterium vrystaatense TaxID=307480 RepID=A0A1M5J5P9_9FLAO|nr:hypothetical protein [Chryseobacterium vrystaatense]SHG35927.1 hypothetical protein SAMN02787073_4091 [Chryseobacterium vrystaatense]